MKKIYAMILTLVIAISLAACGQEPSANEASVKEPEVNVTETDSMEEFEEHVFAAV